MNSRGRKISARRIAGVVRQRTVTVRIGNHGCVHIRIVRRREYQHAVSGIISRKVALDPAYPSARSPQGKLRRHARADDGNVGTGIEQATNFAFGDGTATGHKCATTTHGENNRVHDVVVRW